jgi:DUF4097 and DUF4098 domain-containing protein YvlB
MFSKISRVFFLFAAVVFALSNGIAQKQGDLPLKEDINKTYQLTRGARVEVTGMAGPVEVTAVEGNTATVHVVRSGQTREDLDCYRTVVEGDANRLEIRHERFRSSRCESIKARQSVKLLVPREVDLHLSTIAGAVNVGAVEGVVKLTNIAGPVVVTGAQSAEMSSLAGGLTMHIERISGRGINISGVAGAIELQVSESLDANVVVDDTLGKVVAETPRAKVSKLSDSKYLVKVGAGGAEISVTGVTGNVRLRGR